jgi:hypothetical protein
MIERVLLHAKIAILEAGRRSALRRRRARAAPFRRSPAGPVAWQRQRPQLRTGGEQRQDVALPQPAERVDALSLLRSLGGLLRGQLRIAFDPATGTLADTSAAGGDARTTCGWAYGPCVTKSHGSAVSVAARSGQCAAKLRLQI